ncbi:hypothetical protein QYE76_027329 [Lolium multiflorum]|uniref:Transposon protein, putative, CACTA, En/Spm sub-class n=1 Tax=Lolium multiflorum TaxID=4521 RepID=A0AAD8QK61_LOLMU|nr:hypothetical protein QYE76_027329 [Lolium multiflorum]
MESHDCHMMMMQILPVAIRGIMDDHVRATLTGLCNFFDVITRKSISVKKLARLQEEIVVILCELEMYFPPAFFDVMVHLLVHIMDDIVSLGPAFLHNMMSFERMNGVIKGYVRNRSHPDGSIVQGWLTEECISFCTNYLDIEDPVGLPQNKHLRRFEGVGHKNGRKELHVHMSGRTSDFDRANLVALQHIDLIDPWLKEHKTMIENSGKPMMTEAEIFREHNSSFACWFKDHIDANPPPMDSDKDKLVLALSHGPAPNIMTYQAYDINGYTFYTEEKDKNSVYQNSGVTMDSWTGDVKTRYYGRIEEIWELSYAGEKVPMFRIRWAKNVTKEDRYFTTMFLPEANKSKSMNATAQNEPWVLAEHVHQCFFITDPSRPSRVIVRRGKRTIVGMDGVANEEDFEGQVGPATRWDNRSARPSSPSPFPIERRRHCRSRAPPPPSISSAAAWKPWTKRPRCTPELPCKEEQGVAAERRGGRHAPATIATVAERRRRALRAGHRRGEEQQGVATIAVVQATMASEEQLEEHYNRHFFRTEEDAEAAGVGGDEDHEMEDDAGGSGDEPSGNEASDAAGGSTYAPSGDEATGAAGGGGETSGDDPSGAAGSSGTGTSGSKRPRGRQGAKTRYKYMVRKLIAEGKGFEEVHSAFPHVTQADFDAFVANEELQATKNRKLWGKEMRELNIGNHNLGSRGYEGKEPYWAKEDEAYVNAGIENPWLKYKDPLERRFIRSRYHKKKLTGELVTDPKVVTDIIWFTNDKKVLALEKKLEEERQRLSQCDEGSSSQASTGRVAWDKPLAWLARGSNSMAPPSAGNDNVIMETPPAAGNVAGARDSPSMLGSSPSVTCTPAAACAGPSTLAELNALTALSTPCTFLMRVNGELKDVARGSILRPLDKKWHTRDMEDDVYRVEVDRALPGYEDLFPPNQPHGADDDSPLNLASLKGWVLLWPKTLIRINTYSGSTASKDKHLAAPQVSVPPRQPAAPVVSAPPQQPAAPVVSAPPQQPAAPVVSAPPQQPAAPEAEEYERDDFQWDIPTSSQVVHEDQPASKYGCSKKLFDSQETEEENPEEVAAVAVKKMLSPNTLRATVTAVGDGPVLQPKKRKRPAKKDAKDKAAAKDKDKVALLDKLPNNWRPLHHLGEPMLPEHVLKLLTGDMASLQHVENLLLKSKDPGYPLFVAKVPTGMNFVEKYPADLCFIRYNDIFSIYRMQMLHFSVVRLVALSLSSQIVKEGTPTIAIMDPFYMRESIICNAGDRAIATRQVEDFMMANIKKGAILIPYFPEDMYCTLIVVHPQHSHAVYLDSGRDKKKDYTNIRALLNDALTGFANKAGPLKVERKSRGGLVLTHTTNFPCLRQSKQDNGMDAWYAILQMQEYIKYADDMLLPESLRERSGEFFYGYGLPPNDEIELRLEMSRDERPFNTLEGCRPFPLGMPTTYVVYKGRVPGVYDDWEDCRRQVHRFSGNNYKGYPTRVEAEGRYTRYLAGEMRDMRRNRMKTMAFVMMVIVTMLVMFYVIVV